MKKCTVLLNKGFESSCFKTPEFKSFARTFKNEFKNALSDIGKITDFNVGHFYISGFFRDKDNNCFYFSISDVRYFPDFRILIRRADNEKDYTGGRNCYIGYEKANEYIKQFIEKI